jgi:F0F1-type ATP synthase membrane subunit b/b'
VVNLSLTAAERLLGRSLTGEDQKRLAEQYVRELGGKN